MGAGLMLAGLALAVGLVAQDSTATASPVVTEGLNGLTLLLGVLGVAVTGLGKKGLEWLAGMAGKADAALVKVYKPVQPVVAMLATYALGWAWSKLNLGGLPPAGESLAALPVSTVAAITLREGAVKLWAALGLSKED